MSKVICGGAQNAVGAGNNGYTGIGLSNHSATTIESFHTQTVRTSGTFSNLSCTVHTNGTGASTLRLRKNSVNGNQSISIPSSATGFFEDVSNTDTASAGDLFVFQLGSGAGGVTTAIPFVLFEADGNTTAIYGGTRSLAFSTNSATRFISLVSRPAGMTETVEADAQIKIKEGGIWKNMDISLSANNRVSTTTWTSRINGVDGNMLVSVPASGTGHFEDTSNTDIVSADDLLAIKMITGAGGGSLDPEVQKTEIEYSGNLFNMPSGTSNDATRDVPFNTTEYYSPIGIVTPSSIESERQIEIPVDFNFSNLQVHVITNTITTSASTVKVRKNSADGNGLVSIPAGATGFFEDTVNSDSFVDGDRMAYEVITPNTSGTLSISVISTTEGELSVDKTFTIDAFFGCNADFCEQFNTYAKSKLPTFRDNFNYSTQAEADANWISSDLPQIRVNTQTEVIDYDWTQSNSVEAISFDLGADTVSKEKWALRFKFVLNSFTKADPSPNLPFIGLATANSSSIDLNGDGIGFQVEVRTGQPVDLNIFHRDDATGSKDLVGDQGTDVVVDIDSLIPETFYVELRRESTTKAVCDVYSDAQFTTLLGSGSITMNDLTSDLRYILIVGRDNNGMNLLDGTIEELEFWNAGQQGDRTFEDDFKQKTITFADDFSSYADQTEADASWVPVGTVTRVDPALDVLDFDFKRVNTNQAVSFDLGAGTVSDTNWTLRCKMTTDVVSNTATASVGNIGLYAEDSSVTSFDAQTLISFKFFRGINATTTNLQGVQSKFNSSPNDSFGDVAFSLKPAVGTLYLELKRTSATTYVGSFYSDADYSVLVERIETSCSSSIVGLRYIKIHNDDRIGGGVGNYNGTIDDIEFYNGTSTLTRWFGATGNDVGLDTVDERINFDIPQGVQRDELLAFDLQTILDGANASDDNWTLRFKINTDSITQGASEQSASLFVGLDDGLLPANTSGHDHISFGVVIDQGGAGPQFGAVSTLRTADNGAYFAGTVASLFPLMWTTGTLFVEVKRVSKTLCECTLYIDARYTSVFSPTIQVTIASTLDNLRYIRLTTDSSAVANDSPWDGSIDDIEFYNGVSVPRTPIHETKDFEDKFLADNWADTGTGVEVNTGTQEIDWTSVLDTVARATVFDLGVGNVSDTEWALRFKYRTDTLTVGSTRTKFFWIGLFDSDQTADSETVQDYIGLSFLVNSSQPLGKFSLSERNNVILTSAGTETDFTTATPSAQLGNNLYVEIKRISSTLAEASLYSDPDYSILIERVSLTVPAGIIDLRYIGLKNRTDPVNTGSMTGIVDDVQFWNQQSALDHQNKWRRVDL